MDVDRMLAENIIDEATIEEGSSRTFSKMMDGLEFRNGTFGKMPRQSMVSSPSKM